MSLECPHCGEEVTQFNRTGEKRYACDHCNKVIKHDTVKQYLDTIPVNDKWKKKKEEEENNQGQDNSNNNNSQPDNTEANPNPVVSNTGKTDREIISERGREGLKELKESRLREWLATTDGVGEKTENRIIKVFNSDDIHSKNPSALYSLLDDELTASPTYINTMVNNVFAPEYEHEDLLEDHGYTPFFKNGNMGGVQSNQNMSNGFENRGQGNSGMTQQGMSQQGQMQQQQPQQYAQESSSLSREEALEMIKASQDEEEQGSRRRGPGTEAIDEATQQAIKNMADNMGGFFGTLQRVGESALMAYFEKHPEKLVENMSLLQAFMDEDTNAQTQKEEPKENLKIDNAIEQATRQATDGSGNMSGSQQTTFNEPQDTESKVESHPSFREPDHSSNTERGTQNNDAEQQQGFEPDIDIMEGGGSGPNDGIEQLDEELNQEEQEVSTIDDRDIDNSSDNDSDETTEEEGDGFDELFGDLE